MVSDCPATLLSAILADYLTLRPICSGSAYQLRRTIGLFGEHLDRSPTVEDLTDLSVSRWLQAIESTHAGWTRAGHRTRILSLWRFANRQRLCSPPGEVRREPTPEPQPESWTLEEVSSLLHHCPTVDPSGYLHALILACYDTGLRKSDCQAVRREQIGQDGVIRQLRQHKTGWPHSPVLRPETLTAVLALPGDRPLACPWCCRTYTARWRRLRSLARLPDRGGCQQLRRTGATWVAVSEGMGAAMRFLGHRSPEMIRHYVDRSRLADRQPLPPRVA